MQQYAKILDVKKKLPLFDKITLPIASLTLLLILVPLLNNIPGFPIPVDVLLEGLVFVSVLVFTRGIRIKGNPILLATALMFLTTASLSFFFSYNPNETIQAVIRYVIYASLVVCVSIVIKDERDLEIPLRGLTVASLLVALIGIYQFFFRPDLSIGAESMENVTNRVSSTFGNPNFLAEFFVLSIPVMLLLAINSKKNSDKALYGISALLSIIALYLTYTRGSLIGLGVALIIISFAGNKKVLLPIILIFGVSGLLIPGMFNRIVSLVSVTGTAQNRLSLWTIASYILMHNPLGGVGFGAYPDAFEKYVVAFPSLDIGYIRYTAHNSYLMIGAETGIVGLISFLLIVAFGLVTAYFVIKRTSGMQKAVVLGLTGGIIGYLVNSFTSNTFYHPRTTVIFWVFFGLIISLASKPLITRKTLVKILITVIGIASILLVARPLLGVYAHTKSDVIALSQENTDKRIHAIQATAGTNMEVISSELKRLEVNGTITNSQAQSYNDTFKQIVEFYDALLQERSSEPQKIRAQKDLAFVIDNTVNIAKQGIQKNELPAIFELSLPINLHYYKANKPIPKYSGTIYINKNVSPVPVVYYVNQGFQYLPSVAMDETMKVMNKDNPDDFAIMYNFVKNCWKSGVNNGKDYFVVETMYMWNGSGPTWSSGNTQAQALKVIAAAYDKYKNSTYLEDCKKLFYGIQVPYDMGGIAYYGTDSTPWIATNSYTKPDKDILTQISAGIGVYYYAHISGDKEAMELYRNMASRIFKILPDYEYPMKGLPEGTTWTKATPEGTDSSQKYHKALLETLMSLNQVPENKEIQASDNLQIFLEKWTKAYQSKYKDNIQPLSYIHF
jgi:putative inorganic carbon (hco3(-)) transporter